MTEIVKQTFDTKVRVNRGMSGNYGWEITTHGDNWEEEFDKIDDTLRKKKLTERGEE